MEDSSKQEIKTDRPKPIVLAILDGMGVAQDSKGNAVTQAKTPNFDNYCQNYFCTTLQASGESVGLSYGEMGNSEVGHLNIGAGRIVYQNFLRINKSIVDGEFATNPIFVNACKNVQQNKSNLHLMGLLTKGGVHASLDHLYALLETVKQQKVQNIFLHLFLDGRDMEYDSGLELVKELEKKLAKEKSGKIATLSGRFYAMDRDNNWERIQKAYQAMVQGESSQKFSNAQEAIKKSYEKKVYDEEFVPCVITENGKPVAQVKNKDSIIFFNFRADRARQITKAFVLPSFDKFDRGEYLKDLHFVTMTQYEKNLPVEVAYPPQVLKNTLGDVLSQQGLKQLRIAETEKYAHVTYFFNGGRQEPSEGEEHAMIKSPSVESYAQQPEMSALKVKDRIIKEISTNKHDVIIVNFANPDMVGHTGDLAATIKAVETVDKCLGEIVDAVLSLNGVVLVTADHGNAEELINLQTGEIDKEHSTAPVPFIVIGQSFKNQEVSNEPINLVMLTPSGVLSDIAPTLLKIANILKPEEMTGISLI